MFALLQSKPQSITLVHTETYAAFEVLAQADVFNNIDRRLPIIDALSLTAKHRIRLAEQIILQQTCEASPVEPSSTKPANADQVSFC